MGASQAVPFSSGSLSTWIDLQAEAEEFPEGSAFAKRLGHRTTLGVPVLREGVAIGTIQLRRVEVNPFTNKQIALLKTFADQAAIAIENTRLLNELRESLAQQTATSEVLSVISSTPGELGPVFQAMLENAVRLCDAKFGTLELYEGGAFRKATLHNVPQAYVAARGDAAIRPDPRGVLGRIVLPFIARRYCATLSAELAWINDNIASAWP